MTRSRTQPSRILREDGVALFLVISFLGAMTLLLSAFLGSVRMTLAEQRTRSRGLIVHNLAQAGIDSAIAALRTDPGGYDGETDVALGEGRYSVRVRNGGGPGRYRITAIGEIVDTGRVLYTLTIDARLVLDGPRLVSVTQQESKIRRPERGDT